MSASKPGVIDINMKLRRTLYLLVLLLTVALTTGCADDGEPRVVTVEYNEEMGVVKLNGEQISSGYSGEVEPAAEIELEAIAAEGLFFEAWKGVSESQAAKNPLQLTVRRDMNIKAVFTDEDPEGFVLKENFDNGSLNNWEAGNAEAEVSKDFAKSGDYSAKVTTLGSGWNQFRYNLAGLVEEGKTYEVTVWIYHEAGDDIQFHLVRLMNGDFKWLGGNETIPNKTWTALTNTFEADLGIQDEFVLFVECNNELTYYVDDISVKRVE